MKQEDELLAKIADLETQVDELKEKISFLENAVDITEESEAKDDLEEIIKGAACMFNRFFVVDLEKGIYSDINKSDGRRERIYVSGTDSEFYENVKGRFYNPVNNEALDEYFSVEGLRKILREKNDFYFECRSREAYGVTYGATIHCIERKGDTPIRVLYAIRDITEAKSLEWDYQRKLKKANDKLKDLANRDGLTGLYNRHGLMEAVHTQLTEDSRVAMLLIDVDNFKSVNDTNGHFAGDKLLVKVAKLLRTSFRTNDIFVRMGGDEFMAVLLGCDYECGSFIPRKIEEINKKLQKSDDDTPIGSISVGVAFSREGETQGLYNRADEALYIIKERGRCGCCVYEDEFTEDDLQEV